MWPATCRWATQRPVRASVVRVSWQRLTSPFVFGGICVCIGWREDVLIVTKRHPEH